MYLTENERTSSHNLQQNYTFNRNKSLSKTMQGNIPSQSSKQISPPLIDLLSLDSFRSHFRSRDIL